MKEKKRMRLANEIVQAYVEIGDATRLNSLPSWVTTDLTLNLSQLKSIVFLEYHVMLTISELGRLLGVGNPAASLLVQQMVEQGLVERSEDIKDRRRTFVRLTTKGAGLLAGRREQIKTSLSVWLEQMDDDELSNLQRSLSALLKISQAGQMQKTRP
jgi:DNA-binding MarR family transcriptional regulator